VGQEFDAVLTAAQAGGQWAFSLLYQQFNPKLLRYFAARAPSEADDLAAETWMGVARQLGGFRGDESGFRAWLFTIAHRQLVQHWRSRSKKAGVAREADQDGNEPAADDPEGEVVAGMSAREAARRLAAVLSAEQAEVVLLRVLGDLDVEQVARILGKRPGSIRALQHRALKRLADQKFLAEGVTP
jgi:RNA polymerase sigma factor (sigma-70 family)